MGNTASIEYDKCSNCKQHYVPHCYLREFADDGGQGINMYNKRNSSEFKSNIRKALCIKGFYNEKRQRSLEKWFSEQEAELIVHMRNIKNKAINANYWYLKNCYSMTVEEKEKLAYLMILQFLRTDGFRQDAKLFIDTYNQLTRDGMVSNGVYLDDRGVKFDMAHEHNKMILGLRDTFTNSLANNYDAHIFVNKTGIPFWTSDTPTIIIGLKGETCLNVRGSRVIFPISPWVCAVFFDKVYSNYYAFSETTQFFGCGRYMGDQCKELKNRLGVDRLYGVVANEEDVHLINREHVRQCYKYLASNNEDFSMAEDWLREEKNTHFRTERMAVTDKINRFIKDMEEFNGFKQKQT